MSNSGLIEPTVVYHVSTGRTVMNAVDAASAVTQHPLEWSYRPWSAEVLQEAKATAARNEELTRAPPVGALNVEGEK